MVPLGPDVNGFEKDLEEFVNEVSSFKSQVSSLKPETADRPMKPETLSKRVVALSSGTAAIHLALIACGVKAGDEVCVQSFTFCASSHPITYLGQRRFS